MSFVGDILARAAKVKHDVSIMRRYQTGELVPFMMGNPFSAAFVDLGLGKTVSTLTVLVKAFDAGTINKALIIAPLRVAIQTWPTELQEWSHTWHMSFTLIRADLDHPGILRAQKMARRLEAEKRDEFGLPNTAAQKAKTRHLEMQKRRLARQPTMIHIINREAVQWLVKGFGSSWPYDCVIVDESRGFSDNDTARWGALNSVRPFIKRMHLLSAIPAPEGIFEYFAQLYLLDRGQRLGHNKTAFRTRYMKQSPYTKEWTALEGADKEVANQIADICLVMRANDYLPRRQYHVVERPIVLDRAEMRLYRDFEKEFVTTLDDVQIEAVNGGVLAGKLLQLASGAVYDDKGKFHIVHDHKLEELKQIVEETPGTPLLVAYWHQASLDRLRKLFPKAVVMDKKGDRVVDWNAGKISMLLVHPRSAAHGLNMQLGPGHILVFFDNPLPLDDYLQMIGRLDRSGQKNVVTVIHLVAQETVDAKVVPSLRDKDDAQQAVRGYIRDLRKSWRARHADTDQEPRR